LFSFNLKTRKLEEVIRFVDALRLFKRAVSWGGYESLVFPGAVKRAEEDPAKLSLIRLHIGLEAAADLIADLDGALAHIG
jgi:cystathionine beta-lyase/cystathionine gamma-synthase